MRPITVNLASRPLRNNRVVASVLGTVGGLLVLATLYNLVVFFSYGSSYNDLQIKERGDLARLAAVDTDERQLDQELRARDFRRVYERGTFAGEVILKRSFSWTLLFNKLEAVVPAEVMMTTIRPNIGEKGIVVYVNGIAKHHGALLDLEDALLKNPAFARVYPATERKINPSRPDIAFALTFDYLPKGRAPAPTPPVVAQAEPGPDAAPSPASTAPSAAPTVTPAAITAAATPAPPVARVVASAPATGPRPAAAPPDNRPAIGTVGKDGRERANRILARMVAAPGGVHPAPPDAGSGPGVPKGPAGDPAREANGPPAGLSKAAKPATGSTPHEEASTSRTARAEKAPAGGAAASPKSFLVPVAKAEPNMPPDLAEAVRGPRPRPASTPSPAIRLDVQLNFWRRPVAEAYDALSRAHGVRFEIDPSVDRAARVSVNLSGRKLEEALVILGGAAGHRIAPMPDGAYRVAPLAGGQPIGEQAVREETLPPAEDKP